MVQMHSWAKQVCLTVACGLALPTLAQSPPTQARSSAVAPTVVANAALAPALAWSESMLDQYLALRPDWPLSAALRAQAQELLAEARPRLAGILRDWVAEQESQLPPAAPGMSASGREQDLYLRLANRIDNERALNVLDSAGAAHEAWRAEVNALPGWCLPLRTSSLWAEVLL